MQFQILAGREPFTARDYGERRRRYSRRYFGSILDGFTALTTQTKQAAFAAGFAQHPTQYLSERLDFRQLDVIVPVLDVLHEQFFENR